MLVAGSCDGNFHRVAARSLPTEQLFGQWEDMLIWLSAEDDTVVDSKFSLEMAWFRELWYEMGQRNLLRVH